MDLHTLNAIQPLIERCLKDRVIELEQSSRDAIQNEYLSTAAELRCAAREIDILRYAVSSVITQEFISALREQELARPAVVASAKEVEVVSSPEEVELPELPAKTRTVDV